MIFAMRIFTEAFEWLLLRASDIKASRIIVLRFLAIFNRQKSAHELRILVPDDTSSEVIKRFIIFKNILKHWIV